MRNERSARAVMVLEEDVTPGPAMASEDVPWGERHPVKKPVVLCAGRI
jgi:hypothetical protein